MYFTAEKVENDALKILEGVNDAKEASKKKMKAGDFCVLLSFYGVERKDQAKTAAAMREQYYLLKEKNESPK